MRRWYLVVSPEYTYTEVVIPETGQGPEMPTRDVAVIKAPNAQAAKWAACRLWEEHARPSWDCWPAIARGEHRHPLTGVTVQRWDDLPADDPESGGPPSPRVWRPFYAEVAS